MVSVIHYVLRRRDDYRRLVVLQGVKHSADMIWRERYQEWAGLADTQVLLAADVGGPDWAWEVGPVTTLLGQAQFDRAAAAVMMCGPKMVFIAQDIRSRRGGSHDVRPRTDDACRSPGPGGTGRC